MNLARSKKEVLEMRDDDDDFLMDSMCSIKQNSFKMNDKFKGILIEQEQGLTNMISQIEKINII
jgi:hypothetical protein